MGVDIRLYIGIKHEDFKIKEKYCYFEDIVSYEFCVDYNLVKLIEQQKETNCLITIEDQDFTKDYYGKTLKEIPIETLIEYLENDTEDYRRIKPLLYMLKGFKEESEKGNYDNLIVIPFLH